MTSSEDKKRWKKESEQLKNDLKKRKKVIKKREVAISFPGKKTTPSQASGKEKIPGSTKTDDYLRQQINIDM